MPEKTKWKENIVFGATVAVGVILYDLVKDYVLPHRKVTETKHVGPVTSQDQTKGI